MLQTIKSKLFPILTLCVVFFTTFFATYLAARSVIHNSHASENSLIVTVVWDDDNNISGIRPKSPTLTLTAQPLATATKIGSLSAETAEATPVLTFDDDTFTATTDSISIGSFFGFIYDQSGNSSSLYETTLKTSKDGIEYPIYLLLNDFDYPLTAELYLKDTTLNLPAVNVYHSTPTVESSSENWTEKGTNAQEYTFENLDPESSYTLSETAMPGYVSDFIDTEVPVDSLSITVINRAGTTPKLKANTRGLTASNDEVAVNQRKITVTKIWDDDDDAADLRPSTIEVHLDRYLPTPTSTATFLSGTELNARFKSLVTPGSTASTQDTTITAIKHATELPTGFVPSSANTASVSTSQTPIYIWLDDTTIYYYSEADTIYLNPDATGSFKDLRALTDISGLKDINTDKTTTMHSLFQNDFALESVNAVYAWDTSNVTSMWGMFQNAISLNDISGLATWDVSKVANVKFMFGAQNAYIDTSTEPKRGMALTDLTPLKYWQPISATSFDQMFKGNVNITSLEGLEDWDTSNVSAFSYMFQGCVSLTAEGTAHIVNWTVPTSELSTMFYQLPSSIVPNFTGANSGSSSSGSTSGDTITEGGWTKTGNIWTKEYLVPAEFTYSLYEEDIPLYASTAPSISPIIVTGDSAIITNSLERRSITITKVWNDNNNAYNSRPTNISVTLKSLSDVPNIYQTVEYIESTGTQYINTGLTGNPAYTFYTDGFVRRGGNGVLINNYLDNNNRTGSIVFNAGTARVSCYWIAGGSGKGHTDRCISGSSTIDLGQRFQMTQSKDGITATQGSNTLTTNYTVTSTTTNTAPIYLFHSDQANASSYTRGVLYGAKIYDGDGNLLRDFIPVYRRADNAIGMYDIVTAQFFTNAGTGTFLKGNDVNEGGSYTFVTDNSKWDKSGGNTWTYTFLVPDDGSPYIAYEAAVPSYDSSALATNPVNIENDAATITNTARTRTITLTKNWDDKNNQGNTRPDTVNARILVFSTDNGQFKTIQNINTWDNKSGNVWTTTATVADIDNLVTYEDSVPGYVSDVTPANPVFIDPANNTAEFTNTLIENPKNIIITKRWVGDANNTNSRVNPTIHLAPKDRSTPAGATLSTIQTSATLKNSLTTVAASSPSTIAFYSNGHLPSGYTLAQLQALPSIDVSATNDGSVTAYYDDITETIYIYSTNQITAPADSSYLFGYGTGAGFNTITTLDVAELDTSNVTNMSNMFYGLRYLPYLNLSNFDTSNVADMSGMFNNDTALTTIIVSDNFVTTNVTNSTNMFANTANLIGGNGTGYNSAYTDGTYARIDATGTPGYFTATPTNYNFVTGGNWSIAGTNVWTYTITVPNDGTEYEAYEEDLEYYDSSAPQSNKVSVNNDAVTVTNTLKNQTITITKVWDGDTASNRPSTITAHLKKSGASTASDPLNPSNLTDQGQTSTTWTDNGDGTWTTTFEISIVEDPTDYIIYEDRVPGYVSDATLSNPQFIRTDGTGTIINTLASGNTVNVTKRVTGNMGDNSQDFAFTVTIHDPNDDPVVHPITVELDGYEYEEDLVNGQFTISIHAGQTFSILDMPAGYKYRVNENPHDYTPSYKIEDATISDPLLNTIVAQTSSHDTGWIIPTTEHNVIFTNEKDAPVPSGAFVDIIPFIWLFLIFATAFIIRQELARHERYLNQLPPPDISLN